MMRNPRRTETPIIRTVPSGTSTAASERKYFIISSLIYMHRTKDSTPIISQNG